MKRITSKTIIIILIAIYIIGMTSIVVGQSSTTSHITITDTEVSVEMPASQSIINTIVDKAIKSRTSSVNTLELYGVTIKLTIDYVSSKYTLYTQVLKQDNTWSSKHNAIESTRISDIRDYIKGEVKLEEPFI